MEKFQVKGAKLQDRTRFPGGRGSFGGEGMILCITGDGTAHGGKLYPYLMMTAGVKVDFQLCLIRRRVFKKAFSLYRMSAVVSWNRRRADSNGIIFQTGVFGAGGVRAAESGGVGSAVFYQVILKNPLAFVRNPISESTVIFSELLLLQLEIQGSCGLWCF